MQLFGLVGLLALLNLVLGENVVTLTDATFNDFIKEHPHTLVEFYAPWCGHCKALTPEYEKAATALKADPDFKDVVLAKVDATAEKKIAETFEIKGFPTLKWFVEGEPTEYTGGRTEATIVSWVKKKSGPPAKELASAGEFTTFKDAGDVAVVGFFDSAEDAAAFNKAAALDDEVPFAIAIGKADVNKAAGVDKTPAIVLYKKFDEGKAVFEGDTTDATAVGKFVSGNSLPLIVPFSQESAQKIFGGAIKQHLLIFIDGTDSATADKVKEAATPVAKDTQGDYLFVTVDKTDERILEFFGVTEKDLPAARIVELGDDGMKKFRRSDDTAELSTDSFKKFVDQHKKGELTVDLKSEEIPESQDGDVFVLVGKQFNEIINNEEGKMVFVEFMAPWCGHCKKLAPIYDELGQKYKDNDKVIIAKMDATANEVEEVNISGFPTLKLFKGGEVIDYSGGRDLDSMVSFVEEHLEK